MQRFRTHFIVTAATATQTLPETAGEVLAVIGLAGGATSIAATAYTVQTAAPTSATEVQFTGTPEVPSATLTFQNALTAAGLLLVVYRPAGAVQASS